MKKLKPKKCRVCKTEYIPWSSTQVCCSWQCAAKEAENKRIKENRKWVKEQKEKLKTRSQHIKECQVIFNRYIRLRDYQQPCISCGRLNIPEKHGGAWDCGHYLSVGSHPELRFNPLNAYRQCKSCNGGSGKYARKGFTVAQEYRERLVNRIGIDKVEWLEGPHQAQNWTISDIVEIKQHFRDKIRAIERERKS